VPLTSYRWRGLAAVHSTGDDEAVTDEAPASAMNLHKMDMIEQGIEFATNGCMGSVHK
jgi:hypothetical protein